MNILFLRSNPVNPDSRVEKEVYALLKKGYQVTILAWDRDENYTLRKEEKIILDRNCIIYRVGIKAHYGSGFKKNLGPLLKFQKEIWNFLKKKGNQFNVIHACDFDTAFISYLGKEKQYFIYDIFDYYIDAFSVPNFLKKFICYIDDYICNHSNALIICTEERKNQIRHLVQKNLYVIHNTPIKTEFPIKNQDNQKVHLVYVGILAGGRFIKELIEIVESNNNLELHIGGFGALEKYVQEKSEQTTNIFFYGRISYDQTLKLENESDIMTAIYNPAVPNHKYAAPNKFYESIMLGKPVIMIKGTGMSDMVEKFNLGEVIEYDKNCLREAINKISRNIDNWKKESNRIKNIYETEFSWEVMEGRLLELYTNLEKGK